MIHGDVTSARGKRRDVDSTARRVVALSASFRCAGSAGRPPGSQHAEFVSLRIRHDDPRDVYLPYVHAYSSELPQADNLSLLIVWSKVQVNSVLARLALAAGHQSQSRGTPFVDEKVSTGRTRPDMFESESRAPELAHPVKVMAVDQNALDGETHNLTLLRSLRVTR